MGIQIGSKWVRVKLYPVKQEVGNDYFLGQEVEVTNVLSKIVCFRAADRSGRPWRHTAVDKKKFELHFQPLNTSLENK